MKEELAEILKYRLQQAEESLQDAEILYQSGGSFRSTINRSYYAMFYSVLALIVSKGMGSSKHSGVIAIFDKEYVKANVFPKGMSQLFHHAFTLRQSGDYEEFDVISQKETLEIMTGAKDFVKTIHDYLMNEG